MLYADKRALETNLKVELLEIREKELNFYSQNCYTVGTEAALLPPLVMIELRCGEEGLPDRVRSLPPRHLRRPARS